MLVVHPASCCDVCLDSYAISSEPANSPHAIACGHIFCLTCLQSLSPSACPLCRKVFQLGSVKKLHLAIPPEIDSVAINAHANHLIQRVAQVSDEDTPEVDVIKVLTEVQEWLQSQPNDPNSHSALRSAVAALRRYKALQDQSERTKFEQRRLRRQLRDTKESAATSRAVEERLLSEIQQIENEHAQELKHLHSELDALRNPKLRYWNTANPLPPPPDPLPLERFPIFARSGGPPDGPDPFLGGAVPYPAPPPRENLISTTYVNGDAHASASIQSSSQKPFVSQTSKPQPTSHPRPPEPPRMEERWASAHLTDATRRPHVSSTHNHATEPQSTLNGATHGAHTATGTIYSVRTILRAPSPTLAARPIVEDRRSDDERELRRKDRNTVQINVASINADVTNAISTRLASAAAYISGYGSGYESGYQLVSTPYIPSTNGNGHERVFPLQETQSPEQVTDGFGLIGTHSRAGATVDDHLTPVARERYPPRRAVTSVTNTIRSGRISRSLSDIPLLDAPVDNGAARRVPMQSVGQVLGVDINVAGPSRLNGNALAVSSRQGGSAAAGPRSNDLQIRMPRPQALISPLDPSPDADSLRSETTWGTVSTGQADSMDHLGLVGLHNGGVRGQGSLSGESVIGRLSSDDDTTDEDGEDVNMDVTPVIPTAGAADVPMLGLILEDGADYPLLTGERSRYHTPYPAQPSHPTGDSRSRTQHSSQTGRSTHRHRHTSQSRAYDQERTTRVASPPTYNNTNALSLHFDASLSMHDHTASAISAPYANVGHGPEIIAPTPVVGGPNIAHLWANRS